MNKAYETIDDEIADFIAKHSKREARRGPHPIFLPKVDAAPPSNLLPDYPDRNRGNDIGWDKTQDPDAVGKLYRRHRAQGRLAWVMVYLFWALVAIAYLYFVLR